MRPAQPSTRHPAAIALLAAALVLAQWLGLAHRIEHAPWLQEQAHAWSFDNEDGTQAHHSCLLFDAAAVADAVHLPPFVASFLPCPRLQAAWAAFSSWDAPLARHFSPRAPPAA